MLVVLGTEPLEIIERGQADREEEPSRVVVVEPMAVREDIMALMLGLSADTLSAWRKLKEGPPYRKLGGAVVYVVEEVRAWVKAQPEPLGQVRA